MASPFPNDDVRESLPHANDRAEMAERKAQEERISRLTAEEKVKEERQLREAAEEPIQKVNILEYLDPCYEYLYNATIVQNDPRGRFLPTTIAPWIDFPSLQADLFGRFVDLHESNGLPRVFPSRNFIETLGKEYARKLRGGGRGLATGLGFASTGWISFENLGTALGIIEKERLNEKVADRGKEGLATPGKPSRHPETGRYVIVIAAGGTRTLACYAEEKPLHKFNAQLIRDGLESLRHADIPRDIANNPGRGDEAHHTKRSVAAVMTHTFDHMIRGGLEYSYITNSQAFIFLYIPPGDPSTFLYRISEPTIDVAANPQAPLRYTAVSQVSALILLAMQSQRRSHKWYRDLPEKLETWRTDDDLIVEQRRRGRGGIRGL